MDIMQVDDSLREIIQPIINETWCAPYLCINGKLWDSRTMPGFAAMRNGEFLGYALYEFHRGVCEIMALQSVVHNSGAGTALIEKVKQTAKAGGVDKVILMTTNDNAHAFRFYQRRGFIMREVRIGAMDITRRLKPKTPMIGDEGIPLRDEIEFEIDV